MPVVPKILNWNDCEWDTVREKMRSITYQGENMTATISEVIPGHTPGPHKHEHEQLVIILQGECDFYVDGIPYHLRAGDNMSIPGNIEHYIVAKGTVPVLNLDVFYPRRENRTDSARAPEGHGANIPLFSRG